MRWSFRHKRGDVDVNELLACGIEILKELQAVVEELKVANEQAGQDESDE